VKQEPISISKLFRNIVGTADKIGEKREYFNILDSILKEQCRVLLVSSRKQSPFLSSSDTVGTADKI
jgi:hypothetical protein